MVDDSPIDAGLIRTFDHPVKLPVFEGPLDLLLFLIRKNEINVYDIPIERITRQYLEIVRDLDKLHLEGAGEFFVMAATLMQIKSRLLLPRDERLPGAEEDAEAEVDPRWELVQQLIEYKKFKDAAGRMATLIDEAQNILFRNVILRSEDLPQRPLLPADAIGLWNIFNQVLRRLADKIVVGQIHEESVTVATRIEYILARLQRQPRFLFSELIEGSASAVVIIATFLALLELTRLRRVDLQQEVAFADILCLAVTE